MVQTQRRYTVDEWPTSPQNTARTELVDGIPIPQEGRVTERDHLYAGDTLIYPLSPDLPLPVAAVFAELGG